MPKRRTPQSAFEAWGETETAIEQLKEAARTLKACAAPKEVLQDLRKIIGKAHRMARRFERANERYWRDK